MDDDRKRFSVAPLVAIVVLVLLPVLYVLSVGPVAAMFDHRYINENSTVGHVLLVIYSPISFCAEKCPPIRSLLVWYTKACGGN